MNRLSPSKPFSLPSFAWALNFRTKACRYSSRSRGKWIDKPHVQRLAPDGWKQNHLHSPDSLQTQEEHSPQCPVSPSKSSAAWARLIAKIYDVNPLECAKCHCPMKINAVITDPPEVKKILRHLIKIGRGGAPLRRPADRLPGLIQLR